MPTTPGCTLNFTLVDPSGNPVKGKVVLTLDNFGATVPTVPNTDVLANLVYTAFANSSGVGTVTFWGNYQLNLPNSFYQIAVYGTDNNGQINAGPSTTAAYQFTTTGTFDLSSLTPINSYQSNPQPQPPNVVVTNPTGLQIIGTYGLGLPNIVSSSTGAAAGGFARLAKGDTINWRNNAGSADLLLGINGSDQLEFNGSILNTGAAVPVSRLYVKNYGAVGDGSAAPLAGHMVANSTTLTLVNTLQNQNGGSQFTVGDVGKTIKVGFAGAGSVDLYATISAYVSATQVTLNTACNATGVNKVDVFWWPAGRDDTAAIQSAVNAATAANCVLDMGTGVYPTSASITNSRLLRGIVGDGPVACWVVSNAANNNAAQFTLTDVPWGFVYRGVSCAGVGQVAASGTANGLEFKLSQTTGISVVDVSDARIAFAPGNGLYIQCAVASVIRNVIADDCGNDNIFLDVNPINSGGGTSTTLTGCYSYDAGNIAYYLNNYAYCSFVSCAADSNNINYYILNSENIGFLNCGSESPVVTGAVGYVVDGGTNNSILGCYWTQVNNANNVGVVIKNNAGNTVIQNFYSHQPSITPTYDITIAAGSSNTTVQNLNSVATTPVHDLGTNTLILTGSTFGFNSNQVPSADLTYNFGSSTLRWANIYSGNFYAAGSVGTRFKSTGVLSWSSTSDPTAAADTGISRDSAGTIMMGNGTQDDASAAVLAALFQSKRFKLTNATTLTTAAFSISSGWGNTASIAITNTTSKDSGGEVTITSNGTGLGANPTVTLTWVDGNFGHQPAVVACPGSTVGSYWAVTAASATSATFTYIGTPAGAGQTYSLCWIALGT